MGLLGKVFNEGKKKVAYKNGFNDGKAGQMRNHHTLGFVRHTEEWIKAYDRGYNDGMQQKCYGK